MPEDHVLVMSNISKSFPGVKALDDVTFELKKGEIHALCGENGAGKSTILKVLNGAYQSYDGDIVYNGNKVQFKSIADSRNRGIVVIPQEVQIAPDLTVVENIFMGGFLKNKAGFVDWKRMKERTRELQVMLGENMLKVDPDTMAGTLSMGYIQIIEILRALLVDMDVLALDEPTSSLSEEETTQLFKLLENLKSRGVSIIIVTHKLNEVFRLCERVTVLKDGRRVLTKEIKDITVDEVASAMAGRDIKLLGNREYRPIDHSEKALEIKNLSKTGVFSDISFDLYKGEILGFFGIIGSGRTDVARSIFGVDRHSSGEIFIKNEKVVIDNPGTAIKNRIGFVTEDRHKEGLILPFNVQTNISITSLISLTKRGLLDRPREKVIAEENVEKLKIKTPSLDFVVNNLSGGNQQKVVIAKWLASNIDILIVDEPTRGIDVETKYELYQLLTELSKTGVSIIFISSELTELLYVCDRLIVFRDGRIAGEFTASEELSEETILKRAIVN